MHAETCYRVITYCHECLKKPHLVYNYVLKDFSMPNELLCDQFHVRVPVLVHTCTVSSNVKRNPGSKVNGT